MLPGFRFLFAAILLSTSILVFGLGAAALLRASHEQYVSNPPSWRNGPQEQMFAQAPEPAPPVLAVLRAEPEVTVEPEPSLRDQVPTIGLPATEPEQIAALTTETVQPQVATAPAEAVAPEPVRVEAAAEATAPAPADTLTSADTTASIPEAKPDLKPATVAAATEATPGDQALAASALEIAATRLAALNAPATTAMKDAPAKAKVDSKANDKATKRKAKAKTRHRMVRRPPPQQLQQQLDPFGQQSFATTTTRTR
ncbi:hypothetical protein CO669_14080 [Bradyrhizobium sp. Y36]|uniref:hypothetical protein n=1 Tax=Bradyrhizobium sp. Y36 TaxID=2035447 RepID=UPI000BE7EC69|nr:hypothetical protein [Bradyrhizobium sp. Y36]PDT89909.1 hypothetical protein CO669_14080 [Bradyrhizobium sp. Y36]